MPALSLQNLSPRRSLRRIQTVFTPSDLKDTTSPSGSSPSSAIDFRGLEKTLDPSVTNLILTNIDENGSWSHTGRSSLSQSTLDRSTSNISTSPGPDFWKPNTWMSASRPSAEPRGLRKTIRRKKSKAELQQLEERQQVRGDLLGMVEPRPGTGVTSGGIEEVLHGEA